ncbi:MBL fold metallo-hydrolase [Microlunatus panaciterrae]|uniref:Glyoxylase-like metal-dependent hydrolase (Beta-lactamase superfamily II) n=1 Tax=Microlunatus panaciterrae TaxID=400768 RepID=A0ABS2RML5_9ACTN|nr:MBL fold metallo-hydrolase [Microlunatus panaciterrae]MBM7800235.1 glyoxylase-like metal-dependent hydrolase (beta-lactamase superfamily II) [Microlunatus panaciterrae]
MPGLGHVEPGGPPLVTALSDTVTLTKISVGPMDNNAYLLRAGGQPGAGVLIDAADDPERLTTVIGSEQPAVIVTTHRHGDHWQALAELARSSQAQLVCGRPDVDAIATGAWVEGLVGVWDGDVIALGDESLDVIGLVGHTPGSIALAYRGGPVPHLFSGDSLFPGGPGKTGSAADFATLMDDLEHKVFAEFDDQTVVHPGHGDDTVLGQERPQLPTWRARGW